MILKFNEMINYAHFTVKPSTFTESSLNNENMLYYDAKKYGVNAYELCQTSSPCHRYECEDNGCCGLMLEGFPSHATCQPGACDAIASESFACTYDHNTDLYYGDTIAVLMSYAEAHLKFYVMITILILALSVLFLACACYCHRKS